MRQRVLQLGDVCVAAFEEGGVFLAEILQAAVGADAGLRAAHAVFQIRPRRLAFDRLGENLQRQRLLDAGAEIHPGVLPDEAQRGVRTGQHHRDDGEAGLFVLARERSELFALLPRAHVVRADEHRDRAAAIDQALQFLGPGLAGPEIPAVEENAQARRAQLVPDRLDQRRVARVVA